MAEFVNAKTDFNTSPYFNDYDPAKGFVSILYRPGTVQTRELNQMQTIIQDQVARFGRHIFKEGSVVIPGGISFKPNQSYVKINISTDNYNAIKDLPIDTLWIRSTSTGLTAKVLKLIPPEGADPVTAFVEYIDGGTTTTEKIFSAPEPLYIVDNTTNISLANCSATEVGDGQYASITEGVYFVRGYFVLAQGQDVVVSKYTTNETKRIGFKVTENIITEEDDNSLYSNATGEPNFKGAGAHRFTIDLELTCVNPGDDDTDFVELVSTELGVLKTQVIDSQYNLLDDVLAKRTFEESGDYVVEDFGIEVKEHLNDGTNGGVYIASQGGDASKLAVLMKPGTAYVRGYRFAHGGVFTLAVDKARDTKVANNSVAAASYGSYIIITSAHSIPPISGTVIDLYNDNIVGAVVAGTKIGTARVRSYSREDSTSYRVYLFDIKMNAGQNFGSVKGVRFSNASNLFGGVVTGSTLFETNKKTMLFKAPYTGIKTLKQGGLSDTTYTAIREYNVTTDGTGKAVLSASSDEIFQAYNSTDYVVALTGAANVGTIFTSPTVTLGGSPVGRNITVDLGVGQAGQTIKVITPVIKQAPQEKTKTLVDRQQVFSFVAESAKTFDRSDLFEIASITDNDTGVDLSAEFIVNKGQTADAIYLGSFKTKNGGNITRNVKVVYNYFDHSIGDFASVDSYSNINYADIPRFVDDNGVTYELRDCIDFRPVETVSGFSSGEVIKANDSIRMDIEYYLSRIDSIYVDSKQNFGVVKGIASSEPVPPSVPANAMRLYDLVLNPYTYNRNDLGINLIDNRRYTMRDIGKLDTRIRNLEYYVTLSQLEASANNIQVIDPVTGNNRYKNGFATDSFVDDRLADLLSPDWSANIAPYKPALVPAMREAGFAMEVNTPTNVTISNRAATLAYESVDYVKQPYATRTINVNPYAVYTWVGSVVLKPVSDFWREIRYVDGGGNAVSSTIVTPANNRYFFTAPTSVSSSSSSRSSSSGSMSVNTSNSSVTFNTTTTVTTTTTTTRDVLLSETISRFMRSIPIQFEATGLKPFTKINAFYDTADVTSFTTALTTDISGKVSGVFTVPAATFKTGKGVFTLSDLTTSDITNAGTYAKATFETNGTVETRNRTSSTSSSVSSSSSSQTVMVPVPPPPKPSVVTAPVISPTPPPAPTPPAIVQPVERDRGGRGGREDPIAQSFVVTNEEGMFITSIGIAFATKAANIPVTCQIRPMAAGLPDYGIIAEKTIDPAAVTTSLDGSVFTDFVFDDLVYLTPGEYAFVLLADTQEYTVYHSRMGELVIGSTSSVSSQPDIGVMFSSSNGNTWTPHQSDDMTFRIKRAKFVTSGNVMVKSLAPEGVYLDFNSMVATQGSASVVINIKPHGYKIGDTVTISGAITGTLFDSEVINATHTVTAVTDASITIVVSAPATATTTFGGDSVLLKGVLSFSIKQTYIPYTTFDSTVLRFDENLKTQQNRAFVGNVPFVPGEAIEFDTEYAVVNANDYLITVSMQSTNDYISPVIDTLGLFSVVWLPQVNNDVAQPQVVYVTKSIAFNNPNTLARIYLGAKLPGNGNMKVYYQLDGQTTWTEVAAKSPIVNDSSNPVEYLYEISNVGLFSGFKLKVVLLNDNRALYPSLKDLRVIALA